MLSYFAQPNKNVAERAPLHHYPKHRAGWKHRLPLATGTLQSQVEKYTRPEVPGTFCGKAPQLVPSSWRGKM